MKSWGWLLIGVVWLTAVVAFFYSGVVGITVPTKWLPRQAALAIASILLCVMLFGWLIPLVIGIRGLLLKK